MELGIIQRRPMEQPEQPMELRSNNRSSKIQPMEPMELRSIDRISETEPMEPMELHPNHCQMEPMELSTNHTTILQRQPSSWQNQLEQISRRFQLHVQSKLMCTYIIIS